jgi:hypothetical protein
MGFRLGKHARHIERVTVRFEDVNGPRGGIDTVCRIKVVLSGLASIVVEEKASDAVEAFNRADDRVERAVRHAIGRARGRGRLAAVRPPAREGGRRVVSRGEVERAPTPKNFKLNTRRATAALEASAGRPSRKSTRGSVNRARQGNKLKRRQVRRISSPQGRKRRS